MFNNLFLRLLLFSLLYKIMILLLYLDFELKYYYNIFFLSIKHCLFELIFEFFFFIQLNILLIKVLRIHLRDVRVNPVKVMCL